MPKHTIFSVLKSKIWCSHICIVCTEELPYEANWVITDQPRCCSDCTFVAAGFKCKVKSCLHNCPWARSAGILIHLLILFVCLLNSTICVCVCSNANPLHYYVLGFCAGRIDGIECGLFSNHAPLVQTTLHVGRVSV